MLVGLYVMERVRDIAAQTGYSPIFSRSDGANETIKASTTKNTMYCDTLNIPVYPQAVQPPPIGFSALTDDVVARGMLPYPRSFATCKSWAAYFNLTEATALRRFIAYCVIRAIAESEPLNRRLILRGGAALWLRYGGHRQFYDLDFLCEGIDRVPGPALRAALSEQVNAVLADAMFQHFPQDQRWEEFLLKQVKIEIAPAIGILPSRRIALGVEQSVSIRVADLERILAEKLCALLQQEAKGRARGKDVADIALMLRDHDPRIDPGMIKAVFTDMVNTRRLGTPAGKCLFTDHVRLYAKTSYGRAISQTDWPELSFDDAWARVMKLVDRMEQQTVGVGV
jgi:predicted nucleotidyltransferase component of viral defense system